MPFPITCTACRKTFSIADDVFERKVKGRVVTIKCKQCLAGIRVDGTQDPPTAASESVPPPQVASPGATAERGLVAAQPARVQAPEASANAPAAAKPARATMPSTETDTPKAAPAVVAPFGIAPKATANAQAIPAAMGGKTSPFTASPKAASGPSPSAGGPGASAPKTASPLAALPKAASGPALPKTAPFAVSPKASPAVAAGAGKPSPFTAPKATLGATAAKATPFTALPKAQNLAPAPAPTVAASAAGPSRTAEAPNAALTPQAPASAPEAAAPAEPIAPTAALAGGKAMAGEVLWAVEYPNGQDRELTLGEIAKELASGAIDPTALVWREGMAEWLELGQVPELQSLVVRPAAAAPEPPPPPRARAASASDLSRELPQARPPAPSAPVIEFASPGAQGGTPLPPLVPHQPTISGIGRPLPPSPPMRQPEQPAPQFPEAPTPAPAFPPAPVMVPAPTLAAPFAAPVQSFGRPSPVVAHPAANSAPDWPEKKSRAPLIIGLLLLVLLLGAGIFFFTRSAQEQPPAAAPISALPAAAPSPPADRSSATTEPTAAAPNPTGEARGSRAALAEPPSSAPAATHGFAEMFANGARQSDGKTAGVAQHFDPVAAKTALAAADRDAAKCRERGGPTGRVTILVTFDPSGKVASATIGDPPFAGTSSGTCISNVMKRVSVPAFSGLPRTVNKVISIL